MGQQWPWQMSASVLWTASIGLMVWGTVDNVLLAFAWAVWAAVGAGVVTVELIVVEIVDRHAESVEHIATIAAQEALRCRDVRHIHQ